MKTAIGDRHPLAYRLRKSKTLKAYLLLAPAIILMLGFMGYPLVEGIKLAFTHYVLYEPYAIQYNGFQNFINIFADSNLPLVLWNSLFWVACTVALQFILGFILALSLRKQFPGKNIYQAIVFLPWAVSGFLIGMMFKWMFDQNGLINYLLQTLGITHHSIAFLAIPHASLIPIIIAMVWYGVPFFGIMLLAALQSIPTEVYEAADIDGASSWTKLWSVTLPYIKPTVIITVLLRVIWVFNSADLIYIMTNGGPADTSYNLPTYVLSKVFVTSDFGGTNCFSVSCLQTEGHHRRFLWD